MGRAVLEHKNLGAQGNVRVPRLLLQRTGQMVASTSCAPVCFEVAEKLLREGACLPKECDLVALEGPGGNPTFAAFLRNWHTRRAMEIQLSSGHVEHRR